MQGVVEWSDPPPPGGDQPSTLRSWAVVAVELRNRPRQWGLVETAGNVSLSARINAGKAWWAPKGAYEATSRLIDGKLHVWARYLGEGQ